MQRDAAERFFQLQVGRPARVGRVGHPGAAGEHEHLPRLVLEVVETGHDAERAVVLEGPRPGRAKAAFLGLDARLVERGHAIDAEVVAGRSRVARAVGRAEILQENVRREAAVQKVRIGKRETRARDLVFRRAAAGDALDRGCRQAGGAIAGNIHPVEILLEVEVVEHHADRAAGAELRLGAKEEVVGITVEQVALDVVHAEGAPVPVVGHRMALERRARGERDGAFTRGHGVGEPAADAVGFQPRRSAARDLERLPHAIDLGRAEGDEVDDAAGGSHALRGGRTVDRFDAIKKERIDREALAIARAQRIRLRDAVDQVKRIATAKGLAAARHLLARRRVARNRLRESRAEVGTDRELIAQRSFGHDRGRDWKRGGGSFGPCRRGDVECLEREDVAVLRARRRGEQREGAETECETFRRQVDGVVHGWLCLGVEVVDA